MAEASVRAVLPEGGSAWLFRVGGRLTVWDWTTGAPAPGRLDAVRRPASGASSKHVPVRAFAMTTGTHLALESGLEHDLLRVLDRDALVVWLVAQPCELQWRDGRRLRRHIPDLLSLTNDGAVTLWDVKRPDAATEASFVEASRATAQASETIGWSYQVFTGIPAVHRHNLLWLHGHRRRPVWAGTYEAELIGRSRTGAQLGELISGDGERRAVVWHLIWSGHLVADITKRLTASTEVTA